MNLPGGGTAASIGGHHCKSAPLIRAICITCNKGSIDLLARVAYRHPTSNEEVSVGKAMSTVRAPCMYPSPSSQIMFGWGPAGPQLWSCFKLNPRDGGCPQQPRINNGRALRSTSWVHSAGSEVTAPRVSQKHPTSNEEFVVVKRRQLGVGGHKGTLHVSLTLMSTHVWLDRQKKNDTINNTFLKNLRQTK